MSGSGRGLRRSRRTVQLSLELPLGVGDRLHHAVVGGDRGALGGLLAEEEDLRGQGPAEEAVGAAGEVLHG